MTNNVIFLTQIVSIIGFIISLFTLYGILVKSKDATIEVLRERLASKESELETARSTGPDVVAEQYAKRVRLLTDELRRLSHDEAKNENVIEEKEGELREVESQLATLRIQMKNAQELMTEFLCPHCKAPMIRHDYQVQLVEYNGRDMDVEHELLEFECGLTIIDGKETEKCSESE